MNDATPPSSTDAVKVIADQARFGAHELGRSWWRIALLFGAILLPLWAFGALAEEIHEGEAFGFDQPFLRFAQSIHGPALDAVFLWFSKVGYLWGVVPADIALVAVLSVLRRKREALFAGLALAGSGILNVAAKHYYGRARPSLWESLSPETTYSFPSGHAMGSMTLAVVLVLLAWRTRWRGPVLALMSVFVVMVGLSRIYLGVHYPSDILAGWTAALAWTLGVFLLVFRRAYRPWQAT